MISTSIRNMRSLRLPPDGALPTPSPLRSRNSIQFHNSKRRRSWVRFSRLNHRFYPMLARTKAKSHVLPPSSTELSHVFRASANSVLQAAAKSLALDLYAAAAYCRTRRYVDVEKFERELLSAARQWRA